MNFLWTTIFLQPIYNALVFIITLIPGSSLAVATIILTILVRLLLYPLSKKTTQQQVLQKKLQPKIDEIKKKYTDAQEQSMKIMELYKDSGTNPFSGCLLLIIQIPIILALYQVFLKGLSARIDLTYSFLQYPESINSMLFSLDLAEKSIILAVITGAVQYIQISRMVSRNKKQENKENNKPDIASMMQKNMKIVFPIMITIFASMVPAAVAVYWITSTVFMIFQERYITLRMEKQKNHEEHTRKQD